MLTATSTKEATCSPTSTPEGLPDLAAQLERLLRDPATLPLEKLDELERATAAVC